MTSMFTSEAEEFKKHKKKLCIEQCSQSFIQQLRKTIETSAGRVLIELQAKTNGNKEVIISDAYTFILQHVTNAIVRLCYGEKVPKALLEVSIQQSTSLLWFFASNIPLVEISTHKVSSSNE